MNQRKFDRNYVLNVQLADSGSPIDVGQTLVIEPPFTISFDITRNVLTSANVASFRIYNLNANHRSLIRKNVTDFDINRKVQLLAGYGNNLSLVFDGNITQAWSVREGVDFITQIECFDGGFAFSNSLSDVTATSGTTQKSVLSSLIGDLSQYGVGLGAVGAGYADSLVRGNSYSGQTCNLLTQLTNGQFYIDNGKAYVLADNEYLDGAALLVSPSSGLLNTPVREQTIIHVEMLFEPAASIGRLASLQSFTADKGINGLWKIASVKHRGMISPAVCGDAVTMLGLYQPLNSQGLTPVEASP